MNNGEFYLADAIDVIEEILAGGGEFRMYPKGTSMLPLIKQGIDSVVLKRNFESGANKRDIAFYRRANGQFVLHRVMKILDDGTYVMCGDNQTALEYGIKKEQIIGYVDRLYKGDRELTFDTLKYRLYLLFWCFMPYRKCWRFIKGKLSGLKRRLKKLFKKNK